MVGTIRFRFRQLIANEKSLLIVRAGEKLMAFVELESAIRQLRRRQSRLR